MRATSLHSPNWSQLRRLALPLFFLGAALLVQPCAATPFQWEYTGSLNIARIYHTATLLPSGEVLVAGGDAGYATAELYDRATGIWTFTGSLNTYRENNTATLLSDGRVLVAGSDYYQGSPTAELYDRATGTWTYTGSLNTARRYHTATLLPNGEVLVAGGDNSDYPYFLASAELYDPATGTWTFTGSLDTARSFHTATLLSDGRVLVAGGTQAAARARNSTTQPRELGPTPAVSILLGPTTRRRCYPMAECWSQAVLTPTAISRAQNCTTQVRELGPSLAASILQRAYHTATLLTDGRVLVAGGYDGGVWLASAELYDPGNGNLDLYRQPPCCPRSPHRNVAVRR